MDARTENEIKRSPKETLGCEEKAGQRIKIWAFEKAG
jgi:hypothetical protein